MEYFGGKHHTGKMPHKFHYTYDELSKATGLSIWTIRQYASKKKFDPNNIVSVALFIVKHIK